MRIPDQFLYSLPYLALSVWVSMAIEAAAEHALTMLLISWSLFLFCNESVHQRGMMNGNVRILGYCKNSSKIIASFL